MKNRKNAMLITVKHDSERWGISDRKIHVLCSEDKIQGTHQEERGWKISLRKEKRMKRVVICVLIAMLLSAWGVFLEISGSLLNWISGMLVLAIAAIMWVAAYLTWSDYRGAKNTKKYEQLGSKDKELIQRVRANPKANAILDDISFAEEGLKLIVITDLGNNKGVEWPIIVTNHCVYEDWVSSYSIPTDAKIVFTVGSEYSVTRKSKVNVGKSAAFGYMVGGAGAAAYNASKAAEINASGGISSQVRTGRYPINVNALGGKAQVRYAIISRSVINSLPNDLKDRFFGDILRETDGFTSFKLDMYSFVFSHEVADNYNELFKYIVKSSAQNDTSHGLS